MSEEKKVKQIICMRTDLNMRKGKMIAQGAHASIGALDAAWAHGQYADVAYVWFHTGTTKVCVSVDSETELMRVHGMAVKADLPVHLVTDSGRTEFHDVPTRTCLAIGPASSDAIDAITGHLKLL